MYTRKSDIESIYLSIVENSPDFIMRYDRNFIHLYMNRAGLRIFGAKKEQIIGKTHRESGLFQPWQCDNWENRIKLVFDTGKPYQEQFTLKSAEGLLWLDCRLTPEYDDHENIISVLVVSRDITKYKLAEKALYESEEKFRSIAENLSDVIFITDNEGVIKYISPASSILGYTQEECIGRFFGEFLAAGELEKAMSYFVNALNSINTANRISLLFKDKNGNNFFAELSGSVFSVGNEKPGVLGLLRDISDKMNTENELRKLSRAVEQSPASIVITDTNGTIEYTNYKLCEITGYSKDDLIGKNPRIMSSGKTSKEEYKALWNTINAGNDWTGEFQNRKRNGELYWEKASISPIKNDKFEITHFLGIKEDISDRKESEQKLIESEKRYHELFLNNPVPTYIFDTGTLEFIEVNDATIQKYGYSREEFAMMTLKDIRLSEDIQELIESVSLLEDSVFQSVTMRHRSKDGSVFPVEITSHSLPEKNGRKTRLVMATDITERLKAVEQMKLAKEKAEASDKLKTTFLNNISHEVRTPLNGILGFADIISRSNLSAEEMEESRRMLSESSNRLLNAITNYMDISLIASGNMSVNKKDFFPAEVFRDIYNNYRPICKSRNLEMSLEISDINENLKINTDPEIFQQIISHLLNNAIKFTEEGAIKYGYVIRDGELENFVQDTGIGIGNESISNIFDRFVKEERGPYNITEGSGLGLSIAKGMTEVLGGKIWVDSKLGVGSCFYFTIPFNNSSSIIISNSAERDSRLITDKSYILVAEDDETNFLYLKALLTRATNAKILHATNGKEAIELFKANPDIQLILMDIKMPDIDGLEATVQIKKMDQDVPIIATTAYAMWGDEEKVLVAGCDGYLSKPIKKEQLIKKMAEFIKFNT